VFEQLHAARQQLLSPGAPFELDQIEVRGVPIKVFKAAPPNLRLVWQASAAFADRDYVVYEDERFTYGEIHGQVRSLADLLVNTHGVRRGDRVALAMRNYPEWVVGYWATVSIGAAVVGMNAWWTPAEMEYGLSDSEPKVLIADSERVERVVQVLPAVRANRPMHIIAVRTTGELPDDASHWSEVVNAATAPATLPDVEIDGDDDACIFYTSGTTGFPKGAQLTHRGSVHNIMNIAFMNTAAPMAEAARVAAETGVAPTPPAPSTNQLTFMAPTPLFHVTACNCILHPCTLLGGKIVFTYKWDAGRALELIERERVNSFSGVPTMSRELLMHPDWQTRDHSSLAGLGGGGAAVQPDLVDKIAKAVSGGAPLTGYGLTETHGIVTANSARNFTLKPDSAGPLVPTIDAKLTDEDGNELPASPTTVGVLWVRGSVVIKGYLNRPEATAEAIQNGWFNTGDIARIDEDGFVYIVDRAKDMVLRGGENVYCSEVEAAIYQHPAVAEAAVFGIPDERLGEEVAAAIVLAPGASLDEDELRTYLSDKLAKYKVPAKVWFRTEALPRNASGKFLKKDLRTSYLADTA
jgi:long-chain acyl-CoA synthetase